MPHLIFFSIPSIQCTIEFFSVAGTGILRGKKNMSLSFSYLWKHCKRIMCHLDFEAHDNRLHCKELLLMNINELTRFLSKQPLCYAKLLSIVCLWTVSSSYYQHLHRLSIVKTKTHFCSGKRALLKAFLFVCSLIIHIVHPFHKNFDLSMVFCSTIKSNFLFHH